MRLRLASAAAVLLTLVMVSLLSLSRPVVAQVNSNDNRISMMDDCLPGDPGWNPTGGCGLAPHQGEVSAAEFGAFIPSTLISAFVGHPSWRNEPSYLSVDQGKTIRVKNEGGRAHTFTRVANFGGGSVAGFNIGATRAPECPATPPEVQDAVPPGGTIEVQGLAPNRPRRTNRTSSSAASTRGCGRRSRSSNVSSGSEASCLDASATFTLLTDRWRLARRDLLGTEIDRERNAIHRALLFAVEGHGGFCEFGG